MAYIIYNNNGTILANIANGDVDDRTTSLSLIGKNVDNYGEYFNNNLVKLLTNFSNTTPPPSPRLGQLWFNSELKRLTVFNGVSFNPTYGATVSGTPALTTSTGDLWYDTINSQLKIWNGDNYKLIGPAVSGIYGHFGITPPYTVIREDDTNIPKDVGVIYSYGRSIGIISSSSFSLSSSNGSTYLNNNTTSTVVSGLTIANNLDVKGSLYISGVPQIPPHKSFTAYFDITSFGDPDPANSDVATAKSFIEAGNAHISTYLLPLLFPTLTTPLWNETEYPIGSEVRVVCYYNTEMSVRRFRLIDDPIHPGTIIWKRYDLYYTTSLSTLTNIVKL